METGQVQYTTYIKKASVSTDGQVQIIQDQAFDGERLVKNTHGQCFLIRERLLSLKDHVVGDLKIQLKDISIESTTASCSS